MLPNHRYKYEIAEDDPRAPQPEAIRTPMKPHQLAALHKALVMEREGRVSYDIPNPEEHIRLSYGRRAQYRGRYTVETNIGVLGDMVGYGKTLTALGIIASMPVADIHTEENKLYTYYSTRTNKYLRIECEEREEDKDTRRLFTPTLVLVPRGPVYNQWNAALSGHTSLRYIALDDVRAIRKKCPAVGTTNDLLYEFFRNYDVVLIKNTTLATLIDHYTVPFQTNPIRGFHRIMVDEAHDIMGKCAGLDNRFLWYITASYKALPTSGSWSSPLSTPARELLTGDERIMTILVKCNNEFTKRSFVVPPYREVVYTCQVPNMVRIVQPFLNPAIIQMVNANDIEGAIRELGGSAETEDNIITAVTRNIERDIHNREKEREYVEGLDIPADSKASRLRVITEELSKLQSRKTDLEERIRTMTTDACNICYDTMEAPVFLPCTHAFCGVCIMKWVETNEKRYGDSLSNKCPTCRTRIAKKEDLIAIVKKKEKTDESKGEEAQQQTETVLSKAKTFSRIIREKPDGKFLIFSQFDMAFHEIFEEMNTMGVRYSELKGTTHQMEKTLERFRSGELRVIMLNTQYAGSGIDISCATDVVLFHSMADKSEQAIGRAQRVGRTEQLTVHRLCYPHEIGGAQAGAAAH